MNMDMSVDSVHFRDDLNKTSLFRIRSCYNCTRNQLIPASNESKSRMIKSMEPWRMPRGSHVPLLAAELLTQETKGGFIL